MSESKPFITIVIPVYNRAGVVMRTLRCIEAQTCHDFAVVLVDNASTDNSLAVLNDWADGRRADGMDVTVVSESTPGAAAARNRGFREVKTPWTMFFDSDDEMHPRHVERIVSAIISHPGVEIVGWNVCFNFLDDSTRVQRFSIRDALYHNIFHGSMSTQRFCLLTRIVEAAGGWNADVSVWDDIEFGTRILQSGKYKMSHLGSDITVDVICSRESITGTSMAANVDPCRRTLDVIASILPENRKHWAELKRVILAGNVANEGYTDQAEVLLSEALSRTPRALHRALWRFAYNYTSRGGRGVARLLRPLI